MSHGDRVDAPAARLRDHRPPATTRRSRRSPTRRSASTACSSTPRSSHTPRGADILAPSSSTSPARGDWTPAPSSTRPIARSAREGRRRRARDLRPLGRRRLVGRGGALPRGARRPAHLHLRRQRPAPPGRGRAGRSHVPRPLQLNLVARRRARALPRRARRASPTRRRSGRSSAASSSRCSRKRRRRSRARSFLVQGTLYPDVIESVSSKGPSAVDQEPPQRRRPARADEARAHRAAARAVQGRGARAGRELGHAARLLWRHPFPGPGLAVRCLGEVTARAARVLRAGRRDLQRGDPRRRPLRRRSGRPSACSCRCDRGRDGRRAHLRRGAARCARWTRSTA